MNVEEAIKYCMSKKGAMETYPFDATTLVFKVGNKITNKMFGLVYERSGEVGLNLKCDPELSLVLRAQYEGVFPGYHMNKKHWNTVLFESDVPDDEIRKFIDISYEIVLKSLTKKLQKEIQ
ncbi:MAG: MmcQ/YjbR family DNA-binding protein [Acidaminobacteraceae bacterium]